MAEQQPLNTESPAVQAHLTILQGVIQRMADNSRACKTWCITLVSAILILVARQGVGDLLLLAGIPLLLFLSARHLLSGAGAAFPAFLRGVCRQGPRRHGGRRRSVRHTAKRLAGRGVGQLPVVVCHLALLHPADRPDPAGPVLPVAACRPERRNPAAEGLQRGNLGREGGKNEYRMARPYREYPSRTAGETPYQRDQNSK